MARDMRSQFSSSVNLIHFSERGKIKTHTFYGGVANVCHIFAVRTVELLARLLTPIEGWKR